MVVAVDKWLLFRGDRFRLFHKLHWERAKSFLTTLTEVAYLSVDFTQYVNSGILLPGKFVYLPPTLNSGLTVFFNILHLLTSRYIEEKYCISQL